MKRAAVQLKSLSWLLSSTGRLSVLDKTSEYTILTPAIEAEAGVLFQKLLQSLPQDDYLLQTHQDQLPVIFIRTGGVCVDHLNQPVDSIEIG